MPNSLQKKMIKVKSHVDENVVVNAAPGHFSTSYHHVNHYIDVARLKMRVSEAEAASAAFGSLLKGEIDAIDTIVCLDEMFVVATCFAGKMADYGINTVDPEETVYVFSPIRNNVKQMIFRKNTSVAIKGKKILLMVGNATSGETINQAIRTIKIGGGQCIGVAAVFATRDEVEGVKVYKLFGLDEFVDYQSYESNDCPLCKANMPIDAKVSSNGYTIVNSQLNFLMEE